MAEESRTRRLRDAAANAAVAVARAAGHLVRGARNLGRQAVGRAVDRGGPDTGPRIIRPASTAVDTAKSKAPARGPSRAERARIRRDHRAWQGLETARRQNSQDLLDSIARSRALGVRIANDMRETARAQRRAARRLADRVRTAEHNSARNGGRLHAVVAVGDRIYRVHGAVVRANPWLKKDTAAKERTAVPVNRKSAARVQLSAAKAAVTKGLHNVRTQYVWDPPAQGGARPADRHWSGRMTVASPRPDRTTGPRPQLDRTVNLGPNG